MIVFVVSSGAISKIPESRRRIISMDNLVMV
jgi:hypothetical protein